MQLSSVQLSVQLSVVRMTAQYAVASSSAMSGVTCAVSRSFVLETIHESAGKRRKSHYIIPDSLMEIIDDKHYLRLTRHDSVTRHIMTMLIQDKPKHVINMRKCDIPDQIYKVMDQEMRVIVAGSAREAEKLPPKWSKIRDRKDMQHALASLPEVIDIQAPSVGDIDPVTLTVATSTKGRKVVRVQVTDAALTWLTRAVAHQLTNMAECEQSDGGVSNESDASGSHGEVRS